MKCQTFVLVVSSLIIGCAHSSAIVVGATRAAISPDAVKLYIEPPSSFEVVALVDAYSDVGWTDQEKMDRAVAALKSKAAALGANGILIEATGEAPSAGVVVSPGAGVAAVGFNRKKTIKAKAIFVYSVERP